MNSKMLLTARFDQRLLMNPQLQQVIALLQYSTIELKQQVLQGLEENPLLEIIEKEKEEEESKSEEYEDLPYYAQQPSIAKSSSLGNEDFNYIENIAADKNLRDYLLEEALNAHFNQLQQKIAEDIIDSIDDDGYFTTTCSKIAMNINGASEAEVELVLAVIQGFEPKGIAARDTKECLLLQLDNEYISQDLKNIVHKIIDTGMLSMEHFDMDKILKKTNFTKEMVIQGLEYIYSLDFHPGRQFHVNHDLSRDPELYVKKIGERWEVFMTDSFLTRLDVNQEYQLLIKKNSKEKEYKPLVDRLNQAQVLVNGVKRRNETLFSVARYIVNMQQAFFNQGDQALISMNMAEVASALDYHESTISRITTGIYIATQAGVFELKYFFPSAVKTTEGDTMSSTSAKNLLKSIVEIESAGHVYSDTQLVNKMKEYGIDISRRTIAKYRDELNIPSSYLRNSLKVIHNLTRFDLDDEEHQPI